MSVKDEGPVYGELWTAELEQLRREHQRLLYVAMTRARDHLVLTGSRGSVASRDTWLAYLHQAAPSLLAHSVDAAPGLTRYDYPALPPPSAPSAREAAVPAARPDAAVFDAQTVASNLSGLPFSGTLEWKKATDFIETVEEEMVAAPAIADISPLLRGSILHRSLEELTKKGSYNIEEILKEYPEAAAAGKEARAHFIADAGAILAGIASNPEFTWIFERREGSYSELPFLYRKGTTLVSGVIDRVVVRERKGFVIDYKAIAVDGGRTMEFWTRHYRPQLSVYCEAVKDLFRLDAVEGSLLFLDSARLEPILLL
jgi:ATP-dependent helicase/nuclease subunit A